jgi:hypothetical protein
MKFRGRPLFCWPDLPSQPMLSLLSPQQTCSPGTYGVNLGIGPRRLAEPSGQLAAVKELAFLGLDGAKFGAGVAADCTIGVCSN